MTAAGRYGAQVIAATVTMAVGLGLAAIIGVLTPPTARGAVAGLLVAVGNAALAYLALWLGRGGSDVRFYLAFFGGFGVRTVIVLGIVAALLVKAKLDPHGLVFGLLVGWIVYTALELLYLAGSGLPGRRGEKRK